MTTQQERDEKAAKESANSFWPPKYDPVHDKVYPINNLTHQEGFLAGLHHERERAKILVEALEFYSKAGEYKDSETEKPGFRHEFGCGCCSGVRGSDGEIKSDLEVQGLTAREALKRYRGEDATFLVSGFRYER